MSYRQLSLFKSYVTRRRDELQGWFSRIDAEILFAISLAQGQSNFTGSAVEIGLHHGKSFVALCLALHDQEKAYGIDLFDDQRSNIDNSGSGNRALVEAHLSKFNIDSTRVILDPRPSQLVTATDILSTVGEARLFSIDGGHWLEVVKTDLMLAENTLAEHGVIALDDFYRAEWPDVSAGYFEWFRTARRKPIVPFAIGFNKLFLCNEKLENDYKAVVSQDPFLSHFLAKHSVLQGKTIPVFRSFLAPEFGLKRRFVEYMKIYNPSLYLKLKHLKKLVHGARPQTQAKQ